MTILFAPLHIGARSQTTKAAHRSCARRGYSLIELLCVIGLMTLVMGMLGLLLKETFDLERSQSEYFERMAQHQALADLFRADVASAEQAPQSWKQYQAGPQTLILQMKNGHVVYTWQEGKLERHVFEGGQERASYLPLDVNRVAVDFVRDGPGVALVRMRLLALMDNKPAPGRTLEIAAAVGGDWR